MASAPENQLCFFSSPHCLLIFNQHGGSIEEIIINSLSAIRRMHCRLDGIFSPCAYQCRYLPEYWSRKARIRKLITEKNLGGNTEKFGNAESWRHCEVNSVIWISWTQGPNNARRLPPMPSSRSSVTSSKAQLFCRSCGATWRTKMFKPPAPLPKIR